MIQLHSHNVDIDVAFDDDGAAGNYVDPDDDYLKEKSEAWKGCWIIMLMFSLFQRGYRALRFASVEGGSSSCKRNCFNLHLKTLK